MTETVTVAKIIVDITMPLDGFVTGPNARPGDDFTIVTDGIIVALQQAAAHAGNQDVIVTGGGDSTGRGPDTPPAVRRPKPHDP